MRPAQLGALPPAGAPICWREIQAVLLTRDPEARVAAGLAAALGIDHIRLYASGREALRCLLALAAARSGREEVVVPAYTCFSVPSAVVAAGLRVRLVDVTTEGQIDPDGLARLPLERAAVVVVCNLFGIPEPIGRIREIAEAAGVLVVDDAAQSLGSASAEGPVGTRGHFGLLSFGRGKPLSALGGGAVVWLGDREGPADPGLPGPARVRALARAVVYDLALRAVVFRTLAAIPALGIGESRFDPGFERGPIDGASLALAAALLPRLAAEGRARAARAEALARRIAGESRFEALLAEPASVGVYPRLALCAPTGEVRDTAWRKLEALGVGASRMYPCGLDAVEALRPRLVDPQPCLAARDLAARILTLPTHGRLTGALLERALAVLGDADSECARRSALARVRSRGSRR